jgi:hypothetical protein
MSAPRRPAFHCVAHRRGVTSTRASSGAPVLSRVVRRGTARSGLQPHRAGLRALVEVRVQGVPPPGQPHLLTLDQVRCRLGHQGLPHLPVPAPDPTQQVRLHGRNLAFGGGAHVEQVVAPHGQGPPDAPHQVTGAVVVLRGAVAPGLAPQGLARFRGPGEAPALRHASLRGGEVALVEAPVGQHRLRLQGADHGPHAGVAVLGHVHIPPDAVQLAVVGAQLPDLRLQEGHVGVPVRPVALLRARQLVVPSLVRVVGVVPVRDGVVEAERDAPPVAGVRQEADDVPPVRRAHHVVVGLGGVPQAEAVVVLGGDAEVLHPHLLEQVEPGLGIEAGGVPALAQGGVLPAGDAAAPLVLLVPGADGVQPPVHEHPEALLEEPVPPVPESLHLPTSFPPWSRVPVWACRGLW